MNQNIIYITSDKRDISDVDLGEGDESHIHIHAGFEEGLLPELQNFFNEIVNKAGELEIENIHTEFKITVPFSELHLPIDYDSEFGVSGIRLDFGGSNYIIQESDNETVIRKNLNESIIIKAEDTQSFLEDDLEGSQSFITRIKND